VNRKIGIGRAREIGRNLACYVICREKERRENRDRGKTGRESYRKKFRVKSHLQ
jgi:hypothetical protein